MNNSSIIMILSILINHSICLNVYIYFLWYKPEYRQKSNTIEKHFSMP